MVSLDANAVLRLLLNDVPQQRTAVLALIQKHRQEQLAVADIAWAEVIFVLGRNYGLSRQQIATAILEVIKQSEINCNRPMLIRALDHFVAHSGLSFEDCALAVYAQLNNADPLYTFDKKLAHSIPNATLIA